MLKMIRSQWLIAVCLAVASGFGGTVKAEPPTPASMKNKIVTPFGAVINISQIMTALKTSPEKLIKYIQSQGVEVMTISKADRLKKAKNPLFKDLKSVPASLIKACDLQDDIDSDDEQFSEFLNANLSYCSYRKNWIVVSDSAMTLNLIHEFFHYVLYNHLSLKSRLESGSSHEIVSRDMRTFDFRFKKVLMGRGDEFDNPMWRRDVLEAILDFSISLEPGIKYFLSEEVIIERTLAKLALGTQYANKERLEVGQKYVDYTISRILRYVHDLDFSSQWCEGEIKARKDVITVRELETDTAQLLRINAQIKKLADIYLKVKGFQP